MNTTAIAAIIILALGVVQMIHPFTGRISAGALILIGVLLGARYFARRQARSRERVLKDVPRRPLGLSDDSS